MEQNFNLVHNVCFLINNFFRKNVKTACQALQQKRDFLELPGWAEFAKSKKISSQRQSFLQLYQQLKQERA